MSPLTEFNFAFDRLYRANKQDEVIKTMGIQLLQNENYSQFMKDEIIYKMMVIYPKDHYLHYIMGFMLKERTPLRALYWFRLSYEIEPLFEQNLIDMLKIYFDTENFDAIEKINNDNDGILYKLTDCRFRLLVSAYEAKRRNYEKSIELVHKIVDDPKDVPLDILYLCYSNVGVTYNDIGRNDKAIEHLEKSIAVYERTPFEMRRELKNTFDNLFLTYDYTYYEHKKLKQMYETFDKSVGNTRQFNHSLRPKKNKIHIGYVSGDFNFHVVVNFILPILYNHTSDFKVFCFTMNTLCDTSYQTHVPNVEFHDLSDMNTNESAELINKLQVDVLIDLSGHSARNRLEIFSLNPAPVQMTYLGFPNTTGMSAMHYRITDSIADHPYSKQYYSEKMLRMPKCFLLFQQVYANYSITPRKTPKDAIVVGSLNKETKTSIATLEVWRELMATCPKIKMLVLLKTNTDTRRKFYVDKLNVPVDRLIFVPFVDSENGYLDLFAQIDIMLDPFPYSGTTTSCKSLDNSIPIVSKYHKDYHSHNVTASLLINCGFPELVAYSNAEYIDIVKKLSEDPDKLDEYKTTIKPKFKELMNPVVFMKQYENLIRQTLA